MRQAVVSERFAGPDQPLDIQLGGVGPAAEAGRAAARRALRAQIARLEAELSDAVLDCFQMRGRAEDARPATATRPAVPRLLDLGELELTRDELAARVHAAHAANARRAEAQAAARMRLERVRLEPGRHRFARISCEELGEPGCGVWQVRPRLGLIGMLAGWWQLTLSSGCPLSGRTSAAWARP